MEGEAEGTAVAEGDAVGLGVGVTTTTEGSGQPNGTLGRATGGVGDGVMPGEGWGWPAGRSAYTAGRAGPGAGLRR